MRLQWDLKDNFSMITAQYENGTYSVAYFTFYLNCLDKTVIEQYIKWFDVLVEVSFIVKSVVRLNQVRGCVDF